MKVLFLILAFINSSWGQFQQFPIEFHYNYSGRIATGIPSIRNQVSATGILAQLIVQMKSEIQGLVKIQDIKVGTFNDHVDSNKHLREELPMSYHPMDSAIAAKLEQPFGVNFAEEKEHVMIVPNTDNEFMTNLRKSIAGILRIQPILKKIDDNGHFPIIKVFGFEEDSIFGRCENQYTITQLHPYTMTREESEEESNSSPNVEPLVINGMIVGDKHWRLVKTVDFDKCHDRVMLMHSGTANISEAGYGQYNSLKARSSVSTYFLRGSNSNLKIEKAYVEGSIALNPFGHKLQKLQAITNQTLTLLETKSNNLTKLRLPKPTRYIKTWNYEVASTFSPPSEKPKTWVNYYNKTNKFEPIPALGYLLELPEKTDNYSVFRDEFLSHLDMIVDKIEQIPNVANMSVPFPANLTGHEVLSQMEVASKLIRHLRAEEIDAIFEAAQQKTDAKGQKRIMYLIDILAASGAAPPMKVLLDKIKSGNITNARAASIFMTLTNHLVSPVIVPELMDYAMTIDVEQNPFLASAVLINFATMAHRICIGVDYRNYSIPNPIFGNETCQVEPIVTTFLSYLVAKVESLTEDWQKAIYVEALSNLGTPLAVEPLKVFITKDADFPLKVRLLAISALARNKMPDSVREEVFNVLMDVVGNMTYTDEIRQASISVLLSWHPEASWWQRMAKQTWQEPSQSVVSFLALTAQGLSLSTDPRLKDQADIAAFVLPLMKPVSPSFKNSLDYLFSKYDPISRMTFNSKFSTFKDLWSNSPSEVHLKLQSSSGGFNLNLFELSSFSNGLQEQLRESFKIVDHFRLENLEMESIFASLPSERFSRVMNEKTDEKLLLKNPESLVRIKLLDHITSFLPLNSDTIQKLGGTGKQTLEEILEIILNEQEVNTYKYLNPLDIEYFIPTEIGLPLVGSISLPMLIVSEGSAKLQLDGSPANKDSIENILQHHLYQLSVNSNFRFVSKLVSRMKVLIPWEKSYIEAGVDNYKEVNLPFTGNFTLTKADEDKFDFSWAPLTPNEFPLFYAHNFPYTLLRSYNVSFGRKENFKLILADEENKPLIKRNQAVPFTQAFGQNITLEYQADESYPFTKYHFIEYLRKPELILELLSSPTSKYWQMSIKHHSNESYFKPARFSITYMPELPTLLKENLNRKNFLNKLPSSGKSSLFCVNDTTCSDPIKQLTGFKSGKLVLAFGADLLKDGGNEPYKHSIIFVLTKPDSPSHYAGKEIAVVPVTTYEIQIGLLALYGQEKPSTIYGWKSVFQVPRVKNLAFLTEELRLGLMTSVKGQVTLGVSEYKPPSVIIAFEGQMTVSPERRDMLLYELNNLCSKVDSLSDLQTAAIYDSVNMGIDFEWENFPRDLQNLTYSVEKFLEGLVWPHGEYNTLDIPNQPFKMSITGNRSLSSQAYSFWIKKPEENVFISEVPISDYLTSVVPLKGLEEPNNTIKLGMPLTNNMCAILLYEKLITSFDGLTYPYIPVPCWTITTHDIDHKFVIYTNKDHDSGMHQAQIKIPNENIIVQVDKFGVKVNGTAIPLTWYDTDIRGSSGTVVMKVKKVVNGSQAYIPGKMLVVSMLGLYLTPDPSIKKNIRGACGNFDGNPSNDLVGPKRCIFEDIELFKFAWTIPSGDHCEDSDIDVESNLVRRFQRNCTKSDDMPTNHNGTTTLSIAASELDCLLMVYPIERSESGNGVCVTLDSYPTCQPYCEPDGSGDDIATGLGKCWPSGSIPSEIKKGMDVGYLLNPAKDAGKYRREMMVIRHNKCFPK